MRFLTELGRRKDTCEMALYRSEGNKVIAGVCGGIAQAMDMNATGLRWAVALVTIFLTGIPAIAYLILWAVLKKR